jgi:hypothetical protein
VVVAGGRTSATIGLSLGGYWNSATPSSGSLCLGGIRRRCAGSGGALGDGFEVGALAFVGLSTDRSQRGVEWEQRPRLHEWADRILDRLVRKPLATLAPRTELGQTRMCPDAATLAPLDERGKLVSGEFKSGEDVWVDLKVGHVACIGPGRRAGQRPIWTIFTTAARLDNAPSEAPVSGSRERDRPVDLPIVGERVDVVVGGDPFRVAE